MKRFLRTTVATLVFVFVLGAAAIPAFAATGSGLDLTANPQYLRAGVDLPVFGIDLVSSTLSNSLSAVRVDFAQVTGGGTFDVDDLEANPDGIKLWRDDSVLLGNQDKLDDGDDLIPTTFTFSGLRATLAVSPAYDLPDAQEGAYTFFLTIRLGGGVTNGDDFTVTLPEDAFQTATLSTSITPVTSHTIIADIVAPAVTLFTPPASPSGNLSWKISEPVSGVAQDSAVLRLHGTFTDVPVVVSYESASNTIILDPVNSLVSGQEYDAVLLPDGPGAIVDRAGNELASNSSNPNKFRAATTVTETAEGTTYSWRSFTTSAAYGGRYVSNNFAGATISYRFTGPSVTWYTLTDRYQGTAAVSIDGRGFGTFNNYAATAKYKVARTFSGLTSGSHRITIRVTGKKGSSSGGDVRVAVDAFKAGGILDANPEVGTSWGPVAAAGANGGTYRAARLQNTEMTFVFSGTSIAWRTVRGPAMGQAYVYIDGVLKGRFDNYRGTTTYNYLRAFLNLPAGVHTIKIRVAGTKYRNATDTIVAVDGFVIG